MSTIKPLTPEALRAQAREAAEQHIPLEEANHYEPGTDLWREFNGAYQWGCIARDRRAAEAMDDHRRAEERIYGSTWRTTCIG